MESEFYILLTNIGYKDNLTDTVFQKLENAFENITNLINKNASEKGEFLKKKVKYEYIMISQEQRRIKKAYQSLRVKAKESKAETENVEYKKISNQLNKLYKVLVLTDELRGVFLKYLVVYHPNEIPPKNEKLLKEYKYLNPNSDYTRYFLQSAKIPEEKSKKSKPELDGRQIILKNSETIKELHAELKGYFPKKETELLKTLQGEKLTEILLFPHNQNKFVEVFRRLKYNGYLLSGDTETKKWICSTFQFMKKGFSEPQPFNKSTVWDNLNKGKGEPTKKERICNTDWLPYKSPLQLKREAESEKL